MVPLRRRRVDRAQRLRMRPACRRAAAQEEIVATDPIGTSQRREDQIALVGRDPRLHLVRRRIDDVAEVLWRRVLAVDKATDPQVAAAARAREIAAEVEVARRRDRWAPAIGDAIVDRFRRAFGVSPRRYRVAMGPTFYAGKHSL